MTPEPDISTVVDAGVCVGCGACATVAPSAIEIRLTDEGTYLPFAIGEGDLTDLDDEVARLASAVCPFSGHAANEDALGVALFVNDGDGDAGAARHDDVVGYHRKIVAGHVASGDFRDLGTSGGMTSWLLHRLLAEGHVDAVVHVASTFDDLPSALSSYRISRTVNELLEGRKSRYHVQTLVEVLAEVRSTPGRYAIVGVPCFIKAVRLLADADEVIRERITFTASLVCGHFKSTLYSEYLAWSAGVEPVDVRDIDYRHKQPGRPPNRYSVRISPKSGHDIVSGVEDIPMADWGMGIFKLGACDYCDDIVGETADVSLGDAWLDPFMSDWRGANVAIARSPLAAEIITSGEESGELDVILWSAADVVAAQAGAVRHRRPGLAVRLGNRRRFGRWAPTKRVEPLAESELDTPFARRMLNREAIAIASPGAYLEARRRGDLEYFRRTMKPLVRRYDGGRVTTTGRRTVAAIAVRLPPRGEALLRRIAGRRPTP